MLLQVYNSAKKRVLVTKESLLLASAREYYHQARRVQLQTTKLLHILRKLTVSSMNLAEKINQE